MSAPVCSLCYGSGWIPGVAEPEGPLDELPCPECQGTSGKGETASAQGEIDRSTA